MNINKQTFAALCAKTPLPLRNNLSSALKVDTVDTSGRRYLGAFSFSFSETIQKLFEDETGISLFSNPNGPEGVFYSIQTERDMAAIRQWIKDKGSMVFIRSLLPLCIAMDFNVNYDESKKTELGEAEDKAKQNDDAAAKQFIIAKACAVIRATAFYSDARYIAAAPAHRSKSHDLPAYLVGKIAEKLQLKDITGCFDYASVKAPLKNAPMGDKWDILEKSGLTFKCDTIDTSQSVILFDDKYQSGATMHYVANILNKQGFDNVYGLAVVKTLKNDDNQA